jgi:cyclopropane fatty-acyl-phospholipid synthase-like methyltransferase
MRSDTMPAPFNDITSTYTSAHAWMYETVVAPAVYRSRHVIDERFLPHLEQDARILDVGSGGGLFTKYIADQRPDVHIIGVDLSKPQIAGLHGRRVCAGRNACAGFGVPVAWSRAGASLRRE